MTIQHLDDNDSIEDNSSQEEDFLDSGSDFSESDSDSEGEDDSAISHDDELSYESESVHSESTECDTSKSPRRDHVMKMGKFFDNEDVKLSLNDLEEICAICLCHMRDEIGSPELCDHSFCLECILEWSKTNNSCPQDRIQFLQIFVRKCVGGRILRRITVEEVKPDNIPEESDEDITFCEVCGRCDREDMLLLCDGCDSGHHLDCLSPALQSVPVEEWFCPECQSLGNHDSTLDAAIDVREVTDILDDGAHVIQNLPQRRPALGRFPRILPRTRANERIRQRITRARNSRQCPRNIPNEHIEVGENARLEGATLPVRSVSSVQGPSSVNLHFQKVRPKKRAIRRKKPGKRRKKRKGKGKSRLSKTKSGCKKHKRKATRRKSHSKRKSKVNRTSRSAIRTPKARIAEVLGIKAVTNQWQLCLPVMKRHTTENNEGRALNNQRWRAGLPQLTLLGSNSELDYVSEPDEYGDAILTAGVRRVPFSHESIARRKAALAMSLFPASPRSHTIPSGIITDNDICPVYDVLDKIIESQETLHSKNLALGEKRKLSGKHKTTHKETSLKYLNHSHIRKNGTGPESSDQNKEQYSREMNPSETGNQNSSSSQHHYGVYSQPNNSKSNFSVNVGPSQGDPTGARAYTSYLREQCSSKDDYLAGVQSTISEVRKNIYKKFAQEKKDEDDVDLYSDIEPEELESANFDMGNDFLKDNSHNVNKCEDKEDESLSSGEELVIDDSDKMENRSSEFIYPIAPTIPANINDSEVGSSNVQSFKDYDLEAVSDTDTHDMDKSMNSSISLSDSNMGDNEVTSSTVELNKRQKSLEKSQAISSFGKKLDKNLVYLKNKGSSGAGMGFDRLETEIISDNEEMCFEDNDDNIEEGEIPSELPSHILPLNRPKINIQLRRAIEVSSPPKEFDAEFEEGEIVDESAAKKEKRRERARREVEEIVNQSPIQDETTSRENTKDDLKTADTPCILSSENKKCAENLQDSNADPNIKEKKAKDANDIKCKENTKDVSFKKISKNTKVRNYRDNEKELGNKRKDNKGESRGQKSSREKKQDKNWSPNRYKDHQRKRRDRDRERDRKREPKRKELERYNVRQMINKKEEERKKKDEFGRDVSLREGQRSRSRSRSLRKRRSRSKLRNSRKSYSRSGSSHNNYRSSRSKRKRSYSSSSSTSTSSSSSSSSSSTSSSSNSSSLSSVHRQRSVNKRIDTKSKSKSVGKKNVEKKKPLQVSKSKVKKAEPVTDKNKEKRKKTSGKDQIKMEKERKKKKRDKSPLQSKEVYQAGGSIMVSVNFSRNLAKDGKDSKKRKEKEVVGTDGSPRKKKCSEMGNSYGVWPERDSQSPTGKRTPLQDEPMWPPENDSKTPNLPEIVDLDIIMVTPPAQEPILISDSEEEGITRLPPDLGEQPLSPLQRNQGPKTPPEPGVKFTLANKQILKPITNPLRDEEEDRDRDVPIPSRGPNTPPGPPPESDESGGRTKSPRIAHSSAGTPTNSSPEPDVYDPFDPTKSPSPLCSPQQEARVSSSDQVDLTEESPVLITLTKPVKLPSPPPPPLPINPPEPEERPPEPQKPPEDETLTSISSASVIVKSNVPCSSSSSTTTASSLTLTIGSNTQLVQSSMPGIVSISMAPPVQPSTTTVLPQPINPMQQIFAALPANVANILYPAALAAAAVRSASILIPQQTQTIITPDLSRPPPSSNSTIHPMVAFNDHSKLGDKLRIIPNGQSVQPADVVDMDLGSPTSPDSSDASDIFEPPSPHPPTLVTEKNSARKSRVGGVSNSKAITPMKSLKNNKDRFDALFGDSVVKKGSQKMKSSASNKLTKLKAPGKKNDAEEDIPSSAVDLQVKEKFLKKIQRQERVVEEVKVSLKPFYNRKTISKNDYKEIMKKCVQKVCHNKSGEINPIKIRSLVEGYIKKVKYYRKKTGGGGTGTGRGTLPPTAINPPPPGFSQIAKGLSTMHLKIKP